MILVDTCVWIDYLRARRTPAVGFLESLEGRAEIEVCISGIIYFEVLRGIVDPGRRKAVAGSFDKLERRDYLHGSMQDLLGHELACRRRGIFLPKLGDWLIVQTALDHSLELLTSDRDFYKIASCVPLRLVRV